MDANGRAGGLALFWRLGLELEVVYSDRNVITTLIYSNLERSPWMLFCYGPPWKAKRKRFWASLEDMTKSFFGP